MPRPLLSAPLVLLLLSLAPTVRAGDPVEEARALRAANDPRAAVRLLEEALPEADRDGLPALLDALRASYEQAARLADGEGKTAEAALYREGLQLLPPARPASAQSEKPATPAPSPVAPQPAAPSPLPETVPAPPTDLPAGPEAEAEAKPEAVRPSEPSGTSTALAPAPAEAAAPVESLRAADRLWREKKYREAGEAYSALARGDALPADRRDHWAYCRLVAVLERINAQPRTPAEWGEIHAEIDHIRLLSPRNWYSEYLRNVVVERSATASRRDPGKLVVRGAAPDEQPARRPSAPARPRAQTRTVKGPAAPVAAMPPVEEPLPLPADAPAAEPGRAGPSMGKWKSYITPNFRIFHDDDALARRVAAGAEATRLRAAKLWTGAEPREAWTPRCDIYVYPTAAIFSAETKQPPESPGFSTAGLGGGRVTARLVKVRADYPKMLDAVLPHEVTHIVLADLFSTAQIPRWADEGMAVLSEPEAEQALRARDLAEPLSRDFLFGLEQLMKTDYPSGAHWSLFYAQSVSVTRYLVGLGTPPQFAQFVKTTQTKGVDAALRESYGIEGAADLERRWKEHARTAVRTASAEGSGGEAEGVIRR